MQALPGHDRARFIAAAVIAGGPGSRMGGVAKSALTVGGRTIAQRQVEALRPLFARLVVVTGDAAPWSGLDVEIVADRQRGQGPLAGLQAALAATRDHDGVVCVAGDMPFLDQALLRLLRDRSPGAVAVVPRVGGHAEPLAARYAPGCLAVVDAHLAAGQLAVHALLAKLDVTWIEEAELRAIDPELRALTNVNTPQDLARARGEPAPP